MRPLAVYALMMFLAQLASAGDFIALARHGFDVARGEPAIDEAWRLPTDEPPGPPRHMLIHLEAPLTPAVQAALAQAGVTLVSYVPERSFVVTVRDVGVLQTAPFVDWYGQFHPAYKIAEAVAERVPREAEWRSPGLTLDLSLHADGDLTLASSEVVAIGAEILDSLEAGRVHRLQVRIHSADQLRALAFLDQVAWISEPVSRELRNDRARWIVQSYEAPGPPTQATPLYDSGLRGQGEVVGLIDQTPDLQHCLLSDPEGDLPGPNHRKFSAFTANTPVADHGTHTAGTLGGIHADGSLDGAGIAHEARIAFTQLPGNQSGNLFNILQAHRTEGAAVHSNSWGASAGSANAQAYTVDCVDLDNFSWLEEEALVVFACANDSVFPLSPVLSPENSLNALAVGATESGDVLQPQDLAERHGSCTIGPVGLDMRRKPEIFAPGRVLLSAAVNTACDLIERGGTSMATPVVSGGAALARQYFRQGYYPFGRPVPGNARIPSGALLKATLLVGTVDMLEETENSPGVYTDQKIPNDVEGWGRMNLDNSLYLYGDNRRLQVVDVANADGLLTGQSQSFNWRNLSLDQPLHVCLSFTQPPGSLFTLTPVTNNLDLVVISPTGQIFRGNVFAGGASQTGGSADPRNNLEMVRITAPELGVYTVQVLGSSVNTGPQGFALAATGDLVAGACNEVLIDAGPDVQLGCWGDTVTLGAGIPIGLADSVSWSPAAGLSSASARTPQAQPTQTTTYQVSVTLPGGCVRQDTVTVTVPAMNTDGDGDLDQGDFFAFLGANIWGDNFQPDLTYDYSGEGSIDVLDLVHLLACIALTRP